MSNYKIALGLIFSSILIVNSVGGADLPKEDCIPFHNQNIEVKNISGRWKIVEGNMLMLDFGTNRTEAQRAFQIIQHYGYTHQCFVGRPGPSMAYWKKAASVQQQTTVFVVRHAEKGATPVENPPLTVTGENRAKTLAQILMESGLSAIYSTNYIRTKETVNNTGSNLGLPVKIYQTPTEIANLIKNQHVGKKILVAGHSNTVPQILESLGVSSPPSIGEQFNNLFVVEISSGGSANLTHLKYEIFQNLKQCNRVPFKGLNSSGVKQ